MLEKVTIFKKYLLLKRFFFGRSPSFEKVHFLNNYLFWRKSSSEMGIFVSRPPAPTLSPNPNLYLTAPALDLYLPATPLNFFCLLFVKQLKAVIVNLVYSAYFHYFFWIALETRLRYNVMSTYINLATNYM